MIDHVCDDKCAEECTGARCGEKGHECSEACHSAKGEEGQSHEGHDHAGHSH